MSSYDRYKAAKAMQVALGVKADGKWGSASRAAYDKFNREDSSMKFEGMKTFAFGLAVAVLPALLDYLGGVDMAKLGLSPGVAAAIGAGIVALRAVTNTPAKGSAAVLAKLRR